MALLPSYHPESSTGVMTVSREQESDADVRVRELILGPNDIPLAVCLGFIKVNSDLGAGCGIRSYRFLIIAVSMIKRIAHEVTSTQ